MCDGLAISLPISFTICTGKIKFSLIECPQNLRLLAKKKGVIQNGNRLLPFLKMTFKKLHSCWRTVCNCVKHYESKWGIKQSTDLISDYMLNLSFNSVGI